MVSGGVLMIETIKDLLITRERERERERERDSPLGCPEEPIGLELAFPTLDLCALSLRRFSDLFCK